MKKIILLATVFFALQSFAQQKHPSFMQQGNIYEVNIRQYTPEGTFAQTVRYQASRHGLRIRQESSAMLALDMVRRWLNGRPVCGQHGWLDVVNIL